MSNITSNCIYLCTCMIHFRRDSLEAVRGGVWPQDALRLAQLGLVQRVDVLRSVLPQLRPHRVAALTKPAVRKHAQTRRATCDSC